MIHFIYGPDAYRIRKFSAELISEWRARHSGGAFSVIDFKNEDSVSALAGTFNASSLFDSARAVHLKNVSSASKEIAAFFSSKKFSDDSSTFVLMEDTDVKDAEDKKISGLSELQGVKSKFFGLLAGKNLENWVAKECGLLGVKISDTAVKKCIERTGSDTAVLIQEIIKLHNYSEAVGREINDDDIAALVPEKIELNVFKFVDALASKNKGLAYDLLFRHGSGDENARDMLNPILFQFRNLLVAKDMLSGGATPQKIAKTAEIHPYVAQKAAGLSRLFSQDDLKRLYGHLMSLDVGYKKGLLSLEDELFRFILK